MRRIGEDAGARAAVPRAPGPVRVKALVTRPREQADELAAALSARGIEPVLEPLIEIRLKDDGARVLAPLLEVAGGLLFTSANGVRAFATFSMRRDLPALAVGDATADAARDAGFADVASAGGTVADLALLVRRRLGPEAGALVHSAAQRGRGRSCRRTRARTATTCAAPSSTTPCRPRP